MNMKKLIQVISVIPFLFIPHETQALFKEHKVSKILKRGHFNLKIRVTDFWRSPHEQALLIQKLKNRGTDLSSLYRKSEIIKNIKKAQNTQEIEIIIRNYINQGVYLSKHLCGKAMDIAKNKYTPEFITFMSGIDEINILDEGNHYHLELTTKCK